MLKTPLPKKHLGQHFLKDPQVVTNILLDIAPQKDDIFIEIGPGLGALTIPLLGYGVTVYGLEFDQGVIPSLLERTQGFPKFQCVKGDATTFDYQEIVKHHPQKIRLIGNLPYNVGTPILFHLWKYIDSITDMTFMLQKEVVDRMLAEPGNRDYGRLAMMTHYFCKPQSLGLIPPEAFDPPPKVDSQFVHLVPHSAEERARINPNELSLWVKRLFQSPRKTVANNLKAYCPVADLEKAGINPKHRPQDITLEQLIQLIACDYRSKSSSESDTK